MGNLLFLVLAAVVAGLGILIMWARGRSPRSVGSGVDDFSRRMQALAPDEQDEDR